MPSAPRNSESPSQPTGGQSRRRVSMTAFCAGTPLGRRTSHRTRPRDEEAAVLVARRVSGRSMLRVPRCVRAPPLGIGATPTSAALSRRRQPPWSQWVRTAGRSAASKCRFSGRENRRSSVPIRCHDRGDAPPHSSERGERLECQLPQGGRASPVRPSVAEHRLAKPAYGQPSGGSRSTLTTGARVT